MGDYAGLFSIVAVAGFAGWALMALAAVPASRCPGQERATPGIRARRVEWITAMPLAGFLLAVLVVLLPGLLKAMGVFADHCLEHGLHHPHICFTHLPAFTPGQVLAGGLLAGLTLSVLTLGRFAWRQLADLRLMRRITRLSGSSWAVLPVKSPGTQAFVCGMRRPRIVVSTTLRDVLSPAERRAVLHHEIAHARAGDPASRVFLEFLLCFHLPLARRRLRSLWQQAVEERADDVVAEKGYGLDLAQALVRVVRLQQGEGRVPSSALAAVSANVANRVRRLADGRPEQSEPRVLDRLLPCLPVPVMALAIANHHALETLIGWVTGG